MSNDDDDFWTTWIATTPNEDHDYRGCGLWLLIVGLIAAVAILAQ